MTTPIRHGAAMYDTIRVAHLKPPIVSTLLEGWELPDHLEGLPVATIETPTEGEPSPAIVVYYSTTDPAGRLLPDVIEDDGVRVEATPERRHWHLKDYRDGNPLSIPVKVGDFDGILYAEDAPTSLFDGYDVRWAAGPRTYRLVQHDGPSAALDTARSIACGASQHGFAAESTAEDDWSPQRVLRFAQRRVHVLVNQAGPDLEGSPTADGAIDEHNAVSAAERFIGPARLAGAALAVATTPDHTDGDVPLPHHQLVWIVAFHTPMPKLSDEMLVMASIPPALDPEVPAITTAVVDARSGTVFFADSQ